MYSDTLRRSVDAREDGSNPYSDYAYGAVVQGYQGFHKTAAVYDREGMSAIKSEYHMLVTGSSYGVCASCTTASAYSPAARVSGSIKLNRNGPIYRGEERPRTTNDPLYDMDENLNSLGATESGFGSVVSGTNLLRRNLSPSDEHVVSVNDTDGGSCSPADVLASMMCDACSLKSSIESTSEEAGSEEYADGSVVRQQAKSETSGGDYNDDDGDDVVFSISLVSAPLHDGFAVGVCSSTNTTR